MTSANYIGLQRCGEKPLSLLWRAKARSQVSQYRTDSGRPWKAVPVLMAKFRRLTKGDLTKLSRDELLSRLEEQACWRRQEVRRLRPGEGSDEARAIRQFRDVLVATHQPCRPRRSAERECRLPQW
ncbi:hypothetical protein JOD67_006981 [Tenggerimyces flavus]|nr:hypothetical protein [Tenggerimyces flavus]